MGPDVNIDWAGLKVSVGNYVRFISSLPLLADVTVEPGNNPHRIW